MFLQKYVKNNCQFSDNCPLLQRCFSIQRISQTILVYLPELLAPLAEEFYANIPQHKSRLPAC